ncbi:VgrG-related protein [Pseudonocardia alaniniphila]|uniref:VgrG-related protein n=1 Tax=Pseudonocardia alaniniphila TaxID=75291 RepID=A0ABS9TBY2_9PSEU|nr:VgrG-related protein [Pseudonocardia alaniniphila]MCH6166061.1 VgrG-related protein [Pseudonocardia alaniniphila]
MSQKIYTNILQVKLNGAKMPDQLAQLMTSGWTDSSMNLPSAFELTFSDPYSDVTKNFPQLAIGTTVEMSVIADGTQSKKPLITGDITAMEVDADRAGRTLRVRGYDAAHRLQRNRRVESYKKMTASAIVQKIAKTNNVKTGTIDPTKTQYEQATQPNITDWDFMTRLAMENDVYVYVDRDGKLQFTKRPPASGAPPDTTSSEKSPFVLEFGANALRCRVGVTSAGQVNTAEVRGWDEKNKTALTKQSPATTTDGAKIGVTPGEVIKKFGQATITGTDIPYTTQPEVTTASKGLADDVSSSFAEMEVAVTGTPELGPGVPVALKGAGEPFEGQYTVTAARHVFETGQQYLTWVEVSGRQIRSLYGLASGAASTTPVIPGLANATVTNTQDPDKKGRVKLKFPWLSDKYESDWCRVAQLGGVGGGGLMTPAPDDEVLVGFDRGSLEHPYVIAGLYNGKDEPTKDPDRMDPVDTVGKVNWRSIASREKHMIELLDARTRGKMGIRMRTGDGLLSMYLDQTKTTITVDSKGAVSITGALNVSIEAGGDLALKGGGAVTIGAGGAVNITAGAEIGLNATGVLTTESVGITTIKSVGPIAIDAGSAVQVGAPDITLVGIVTANGVPVI